MGRSAPRREEIIDDLLTDCAVEEATVQAGFAAGEDEVAALVDSQRQTYTDFPEARAVVDSYCEDTGITLEDYWAMAWTGPAVMGGPFFHIDVIDSGLGLRTYVPPVLSSYSDFRGAGHPWPRDVRVSEDGGAILYDAVVDRDVYKNGLEDQPLLFQRGLYTITMDLATGEQTWTRSDLPEAG